MLKPENLENLLSTLVVDSIAFNLATGEHSVWLFRTIDRKKKKEKKGKRKRGSIEYNFQSVTKRDRAENARTEEKSLKQNSQSLCYFA